MQNQLPYQQLQLVPPGAILDRLIDGIHRGVKTATTALKVSFEMTNQPLPNPGDRYVLVDSANSPAALIELTEVRACRFADVGIDVARAEGDWFESVEQWREAHERFFNRSADAVAAYLGQESWRTTDDTMVVVRFFTTVES